MISFQNPSSFLLLLLIPLLYVLRKTGLFKRVSFPAVLCDWGGTGFEWKARPQKILSAASKAMYHLAFIALTTALADPAIVRKEKVFTEPGTDVVFVLDASPSMAARDMEGLTRLDAAKQAITSIMETQEGYGFGLVIAGSEAAVAVPPTVNHEHFRRKLDSVAVGSMGDGSALGDGLSTAVYHLVTSSAQKKCIILLTDGENNAGKVHPETAAKLSADYGITLYVVGIGTKGSVPFDYTDPKTGKQYSGLLESNYSSAALRKIAVTGGGRYFEVRTIDELKFSLESAAAQQSVNQNFTFRNSETPLYKNAVLAALILFILASYIRLVILRGIFVLKLTMRHKKRVILKGFFLTLSFLCGILAWSGISWGTYLAPVQKNATSVVMVFDISYSMLATDCPEKRTRLQTAALYAKELLSRMEDTSVSVVIAKGDGTEIIPTTQDKAAVSSLLDVLSPSLMTVPGSSIGRGIERARQSLPENFSAAGRIWVFTDGEETDGALEGALTECIRAGIPVSIIGFGEETESAVMAGDGITTVKTALRSEKLRETIARAEEKYRIFRGRTQSRQNMIQYVPYSERGSAVRLLNQISFGAGNSASGGVSGGASGAAQGGGNLLTSYEVKPVPRHRMFLLLAVIFTAISFVASEAALPQKPRAKVFGGALVFLLLFTGCSSDTANVMKGLYAYRQKQYGTAVASFKKAVENARETENQKTLDYALYNLGTTYAAMEESEAASRYFSAISEQAPQELRFAAYYNAGILAHKNGDFESARENFRKALEIDSRSLDAKMNMELSLQKSEDRARQNQSSAVQGSTDDSSQPEVEKSIFEHIKENDQKQWKNSEQTDTQHSAEDF